MPQYAWGMAGLLLLFGVTGELQRLFRQAYLAGQAPRVWSGVAISAWWAVFAGALVWLGFRRSVRAARVAGLLVAGCAIVKVLLVDLSSLDAFYRVASVFILGVGSLLVAWLYHRHTQGRIDT
jgi:uncharacterized membrane protein